MAPAETAHRPGRDRADPDDGTRDGRAGTVVLLAIVATLVVVFSGLGLWQLDRWGDAKDDAAAVAERLDTVPFPLAEVADLAGDPEALRYQPVALRGTWQPSEEVLWRNRAWRGTAGFHVVTPFVLDEPVALPDGGTADTVLVDRGWVPSDRDEPPVADAEPVGGATTVRGHLLPSIDQPGFGARDPEEGELDRVFNVDVGRLDPQVDGTLFPLFVRTSVATSADAGDLALPRVPEPPSVDTTQNLSYAVQWFSFAAIAVGATAAYLRRRRSQRGRTPQ